jgi:hypothetical protein
VRLIMLREGAGGLCWPIEASEIKQPVLKEISVDLGEAKRALKGRSTLCQ